MAPNIDPLEHLELARLACIRRFRRRSTILDMDDIIQTGYEALVRAARAFDPAKGFAFSTYAYRAVVSAVSRLVSTTHKAGQLPIHVADDMIRSKNANSRKAVEAPRLCAMGEVFANGGGSLSDLSERHAGLVAWEYDGVVDRVTTQWRAQRVRDEVNGLESRESAIVRSRHLQQPKDTLNAIGQRMGITRERVRQLEADAMVRLRYRLRDVGEEMAC